MEKSFDEQGKLFDKILKLVGDDGWYQKMLLWGFLTSYSVLMPFTCVSQFFQVSLPDHWCHVPGKPANMSMTAWKNITIPWDVDKKKEGIFERSKCLRFTGLPEDFGLNSSLSDISNLQYSYNSNDAEVKNITAACETGWDYDHTWYDSTLATDQNWVCDRASLSAVWLSVAAIGNLVGTLAFTPMADRVGRKATLLGVSLIYIVVSLVRLYLTQSTAIIMVMMFLYGLAFPTLLQIAIVLLYEQITPNWRERNVGMAWVGWFVGMCILPLVAWLSRDWKLLGIITTVPFIPMMGILWYIHETPQWLAVKGHLTRAKDVLSSIAGRNGKEIPPNLDNMLKELNYQEINPSQQTVLELFKHKNLRKRTILLTISSTCDSLLYYGLIYTTAYLSGNEFLNFFYQASVEFPGTILGWKVAGVFGRRWSKVSANVVIALFCLLAVLLPGTADTSKTVLLVLCKFVISVSSLVLYIQENEFFPTSHRGSGIGFVTVITASFVFGVPYIAFSATYWPKFPFLILACLGMVGAVAASLLPETMGISLPQTIEEGENNVNDQKFWSYYGWKPKWFN